MSGTAFPPNGAGSVAGSQPYQSWRSYPSQNSVPRGPPSSSGQMLHLPPSSLHQDAMKSLSSGFEQIHLGQQAHSHSNQQMYGYAGSGSHPPPPSSSSISPPSSSLLPPPKTGQPYIPLSSSIRTAPPPPPPSGQMGSISGHSQASIMGQGSRQALLSQTSGHGYPPPPNSGQIISGPPTSGQRISGPPTSGQGIALLPTSGQGIALLPTSGQGIPPPFTSGQSHPPPTSGQGLLSSPPQEHGLLPPPTVGQVFTGQATGQGLLPPPTSGQGLLPPPPIGIPPHLTSGQGLLPAPTPGKGLLPPPTSGQGLLPPPLAGSQFRTSQSVHHAVLGQGPAPPPTSGQPYATAPHPPPPVSGQAFQPPPPTGQSSQMGPAGYRPPRPNILPGQGPQLPPSSSSSSSSSHVPPSHHGSAPPSQPSSAPTVQNAPLDPALRPVNLLESRNILPPTPITPPKIVLPAGLGGTNPKPEVMCCTMNALPTTSSLLGKLKLPLAIHIHPFKDVTGQECPVMNPMVIVRCRVCRTYINPFVVFIDSRHWRCNLCFRANALPENYDCNPQSGRHGDLTFQTELRHSSVEYIAPSEYMLRPPQPSVYYFLIDVSYNAIHSGVVGVACRCLLECLDRLPGDARTMIGFLTYHSSLHFYNLNSSSTQPQMMVVSDVDDVFLPSPDSLLVNLRESKEMVRTLLEDLPGMFATSSATHSALGAALQAAERLLHNIGGRMTVLQSSLPNIGPGALKYRDIKPPATKMDTLNMAAGSDYYKKLALECSSQQIAVDLFCFSSHFIDLSTISCVSKFSSGQVFYYPDFSHTKEVCCLRFEKDFRRYLTRKIGFEAVMRIRCTEGVSLHTFHGNFFVRSTDLLSLPNTNPDHGYTMNIAIDESLKDMSTICFQAALLYTSHRGERRIRVHSLCLPVTSHPSILYSKLNIQAIVGVLANMAVDRASSSTLGDARDALMNTVIDATKMYRSHFASSLNSSQFCLPASISLLPLFTLSLLKNPAFTLSSRVSYDSRTQAMNIIKSHPLSYLMLSIYPQLYALHLLTEEDVVEGKDGKSGTQLAPPILQASAEKISRYGIYLLDCGLAMYIWVCKDVAVQFIDQLFGVTAFEMIPEVMLSLPQRDSQLSGLVHRLIKQIRSSRQHFVSLQVIRENGPQRLLFIEKLLEDRTDDGTSYFEFLSHVNRQLGK